jgi:glycosyltransferase involved in cell wall biosynthesis
VTHDSALRRVSAIADEPRAGGRARSARAKPRIVLMQTQAEGAGAQEISRILGLGLEARGYDVHHVFFFRRTAAYDRQPNTFFCALERPAGPLSVARMFAALVRHLKELRPDVVLCFQHYGNLIGTLAARLAGIRAIVANRTSAKLQEPRWTHWAEFAFGTAGLFTRLVVNSKAMVDEYGAYPRRYRARVLRIDHGFETKTSELSRDAARALFGLPRDVPVLGSVARLHPAKNLDAAIKLMTADPTWHLALAGQGAARKQLEALATSLGVSDRLHFVGELAPDRIGAFLRALNVFVFPSHAETFGLAVVEAAQAGVPAIANDLHILHEVLAVDGTPCALFVDANDPAAFAAAVRKLLADADLRADLSARGAGLTRRYSLDAMVARYVELIEEVGAHRSGAATR